MHFLRAKTWQASARKTDKANVSEVAKVDNKTISHIGQGDHVNASFTLYPQL